MTSTSFDRDVLFDKGSARADGLTEVGPGEFLDGLDRFVDSLNREARLNDVGRFIAEERILLHVKNRLEYVHDREQYPEIAQVDVVKPVFIVGLPRTGTTILHDILNQDPANRAPLTWELDVPVAAARRIRRQRRSAGRGLPSDDPDG